MSRVTIVIGFFLMSFCSVAQITTPEKRKFNIGFYGGLNIVKQRPVLSLDINYKGTTLRVMPNYRSLHFGLTQELLKISPTFYNLYWTASLYGGTSFDFDQVPSLSTEEYKISTTTGIFTTGLKTYFSKRCYTHIIGGVMYNMHSGGKEFGVKDKTELLPYFEFGIGVLVSKTYPKLKPEETEE